MNRRERVSETYGHQMGLEIAGSRTISRFSRFHPPISAAPKLSYASDLSESVHMEGVEKERRGEIAQSPEERYFHEKKFKADIFLITIVEKSYLLTLLYCL